MPSRHEAVPTLVPRSTASENATRLARDGPGLAEGGRASEAGELHLREAEKGLGEGGGRGKAGKVKVESSFLLYRKGGEKLTSWSRLKAPLGPMRCASIWTGGRT